MRAKIWSIHLQGLATRLKAVCLGCGHVATVQVSARRNVGYQLTGRIKSKIRCQFITYSLRLDSLQSQAVQMAWAGGFPMNMG